MENMTF